jgi:hypothetical protein
MAVTLNIAGPSLKLNVTCADVAMAHRVKLGDIEVKTAKELFEALDCIVHGRATYDDSGRCKYPCFLKFTSLSIKIWLRGDFLDEAGKPDWGVISAQTKTQLQPAPDKADYWPENVWATLRQNKDGAYYDLYCASLW